MSQKNLLSASLQQRMQDDLVVFLAGLRSELDVRFRDPDTTLRIPVHGFTLLEPLLRETNLLLVQGKNQFDSCLFHGLRPF